MEVKTPLIESVSPFEEKHEEVNVEVVLICTTCAGSGLIEKTNSTGIQLGHDICANCNGKGQL